MNENPGRELNVEMERTEELVPCAANAKKHTEMQISQICNSIREFGFLDPVGVWSNANGDSEIVEGHGRVLAAQRLGIEEIPVLHLDKLTDEQRRAYTLAHNQLTMNTGWDAEALELELDDLASSFDMDDFGFFLVPKFDPLKDLEENGFATNALERNTDEFGMTFTFPASVREKVESYVKAVSKKTIVERIIQEAEKWE